MEFMLANSRKSSSICLATISISIRCWCLCSIFPSKLCCIHKRYFKRWYFIRFYLPILVVLPAAMYPQGTLIMHILYHLYYFFQSQYNSNLSHFYDIRQTFSRFCKKRMRIAHSPRASGLPGNKLHLRELCIPPGGLYLIGNLYTLVLHSDTVFPIR